MRIVVAPTAFKGCLTASEAAQAIAAGVRRALPDAEIAMQPISDGGDGFLEALTYKGRGKLITTWCHDPLGRPIEADWAFLNDGTAVIEMARASGLALLREHERDALGASSCGTGELVRAALEQAAARVVVGLGGSASTDGGTGLLSALGFRFLDSSGAPLPPGGGSLVKLDAIAPPQPIPDVEIVAACDVTNVLCGPQGAAAIYGPQKGASEEEVRVLDFGLRRLAEVAGRTFGRQTLDLSGGGAAGGTAAGMRACLGSVLIGGADYVLEKVELRRMTDGADLLITGEGRLDAQTMQGKIVGKALEMAADLRVPALLCCGVVGVDWSPGRRRPVGVLAIEQFDRAAVVLADSVARYLNSTLKP